MGSRGIYATGKSVDYIYKTVDIIEDVKVLKSISKSYHGLPESFHFRTC